MNCGCQGWKNEQLEVEIHRAAKAAVCEIMMVNPGPYTFVQSIQCVYNTRNKPAISFDDNVSMWAQQLYNKWATLGKRMTVLKLGWGNSL